MAIDSISDYVTALLKGQSEIEMDSFHLKGALSCEMLSQTISRMPFPQEIAYSLFGEFDGQRSDGLKLFCEFSMLSSGGCSEIYGDMIGFSQTERGGPSDPRIRGDIVWREAWFPFAWNQNTNRHLCIDLDPTSKGTPGQVIYVGDWGELSVHGNSFIDFLNIINGKLLGANYELYDGVWNEFRGLIVPVG